jgi:hypothetical protein
VLLLLPLATSAVFVRRRHLGLGLWLLFTSSRSISWTTIRPVGIYEK